MKYGILLAGITCIILMGWSIIQNHKMQVPDTDHWIACDSGFFYDTNSYQEGDWYKAELHALNVCDKHKKRGKNTPEWFVPSEGPNNGIVSLNSDSVEVDNLLIVNFELDPRDHHDTMVAYRYEK